MRKYVGQTCNFKSRENRHKNTSTQCTAFANAIKKYGFDNFILEILKEGLTLDQANFFESFYIAEMQTLSPLGYNLRTGGDNSVFSEESKIKLSKTLKGRPLSDEHVKQLAKLHESAKGRKMSAECREKNSARLRAMLPMSDESKAKISAARKGTKATAEAREKMSLAGKGRKKSEEHKLKIGLGNKGKILSEETKAKLRLANIGKKQLPETIANVVAGKARCRQYRLKNSQQIDLFEVA